MIRNAITLSCIVGILFFLTAATGGATGNSPAAAVGASVAADSGKLLQSSVGRSFGSHLRHMLAARHARRISKQAMRQTGSDPVTEDIKPAETKIVYANPVSPGAGFDLSLRDAGQVRLEVYNVAGRKVTTLIDRPMAGGTYSVQWDGNDAGGHPVTAGVYFCRLETRDKTVTTKLVVRR